MKKAFFLLFLCFGFAVVTVAQQAKTPPKVTIVKHQAPAKKKTGKKVAATGNRKPPKVDLSNFKPPAKQE